MAVALTTAALGLRPFTAVGVVGASDHPGIYETFRFPVLVLIGKSSNIQTDVEAHQRGGNGSRTRCALHCRFEDLSTSQVDDRHAESLARYRRSHNSNVPIANPADCYVHLRRWHPREGTE